MFVASGARGPGLRKTRGDAIGQTRALALVKVVDARWRDLVEAADIVSEGSSRLEGDAPTWYGSTSLLLALPDVSAGDREKIAALAWGDPHLRVRVLRIAHREAAARAPATLGSATCELRTAADPRGLRIDVDVQAPLIGVRAPGSIPGGGTPPA